MISRTALRLVGVVAGLVLASMLAAPSQAAPSAAVLRGTWVGPATGYALQSCGGHGVCLGSEKIVITKTKGHAAKGTWQYRAQGARAWSKPQPVTFAVRAEGHGTWEVYGADASGVYEGVLDPATGVLELTYMSPGPDGITLFFKLTKKK